MKALLPVCIYMCCFFVSQGQWAGEFTAVDNKIAGIPSSETNSTSSIADFIGKNFSTEKEKLRAAYYWVANNIKYDTDSMYVINSGKDSLARIAEALRRRKGVCENFAAIFNDIAVKCGIRSYELTGYTKQYGRIDKAAHTWCVVYLDGEWFCCDPTWDINFSGQAKYFLASPAAFIESHMPFDPLWQLLDHTVSHKEFYEGNEYSKKNNPAINFKDSVDAYLKMTQMQQLESAAERIKRSGIANELVRVRLVYLQMEMSINNQEKDMNGYNAAVADLNKANSFFNTFIEYRNNRFIPLKADYEIKKMLSPVYELISSALKKLDELDSSVANFQYDSGSLRTRLDGLAIKLQKQNDFLTRYFEAPLAEREKLFYQ